MANYLLVHGAWHGAWCWRRVIAGLTDTGHRVHAVTLTGVGERAHLLHAGITLETHIQDVIAALDAEELDPAILVVHSYAGMLGTAVADRMPHRLSHLVYVDAVVPKPGESWSSTHAPAVRQARLDAAGRSSLNAFDPPDPVVFGLAADDHEWVRRRQTPMPAQPYTAPLAFDPARVSLVPRTFVDCMSPALATIDAIRQRVRDQAFWGGSWVHHSSVVELATGHDPMISAPADLTVILLACANR